MISLDLKFRHTVVQIRRYSSRVNKVDISKVLIANRGEIACRIIKTARRLGVKTVAVYSDADKNSMHVAMADEAFHIGPSPSSESYLKQERLIEIAHRSGSTAIHPGYGFVSENADFAELCEKKGVIFIGPPASAIRKMGIKSTSKMIMESAGVPVIPGYHGEDQSDSKLEEEAERIGFPLMIKAVLGGGGKGMRATLTADTFKEQLDSARREAEKAFGDGGVLLERLVTSPRHVEVQVFADQHGNCVHLFERDCSVQRRHQKVLEEAPGPGISKELRDRLGMAGVRAAQAVGYVGAGTVEFIMDRNTKDFYFMEMNTRLQVEHPVTEMITGVDLVEWQLLVASGEKLPKEQSDLSPKGHSFEGRVYAEDPANGFMPGAGPLLYLNPPENEQHVRIETGVRQHDDVSVYYDPMIAKVVVWAEERKKALQRLDKVLSKFHVAGMATNIEFLRRLVQHEAIRNGDVHTGFIPEHENQLLKILEPPKRVLAEAAVALILLERLNSIEAAKLEGDEYNPFVTETGFRLNHLLKRTINFEIHGQSYKIETTYRRNNRFTISFENSDDKIDLSSELKIEGTEKKVYCNFGDTIHSSSVFIDDDHLYLFSEERSYHFHHIDDRKVSVKDDDTSSLTSDEATSPMPGIVEKIMVQPGSDVKAGDPLLVVIAMKMEHVIKSPKNGVIKEVLCKQGESIKRNIPLVSWES
ncbi:hypothetical protein LSTR_LSTR004924 [Laodelphax striatellus]|uniref:Methylcrotonoyl-CoA carboxylase subunit alpha, mitochondrial n=1 Tax=Laodelphax striatellus TaxID=195883 RepID=A0A482XM69_LAOST|nr:hypothetical protein LSTR_LSTR004924 [Laodelphax striatellus]